MNSINTFEVSGRAFIGSEKITWDGITTPAPSSLNNVTRGIDGTTAASHTTADSVYNSWLPEMIETMTAHVDDRLTNWDPFGDVRSPADKTPATIELLTRKLTLVEAFQKLGVQRSDRSIQKTFMEDADKLIAGLQAPEGDPKAVSIEPQWFVDTLNFGPTDVVGASEAFLEKQNLDPDTASITNISVAFYGSDWDQRRDPADSFSSTVKSFIYWSTLQNRYIFRSLVTVDENTNIHYKHSTNRLNNFRIRRAIKSGSIPLRRG